MAEPASRSTTGLDGWRASTLETLIAWDLGCAAASAAVLTHAARSDPGLGRMLVGGWTLFGALAVVAVLRRLPWRPRALLFLGVNFGIVVLAASSLRPGPIGVAHALALVTLSGLLLGGRASALAGGLVIATLGGAALVAATGAGPLMPASTELPHAWVVALAGVTPPVVMVVLAGRSIVGRLEAALALAVRTVGELESARARLVESEKAELTGKLSRALAHDLNNTLTVVMANAEWLTERLDDHEDVEAASQICEAARNAATLTQYALLASRAGMSQPRPVDITRATAVAVGALRRLLPPDVTVESRLGGPVWAHFDPGQFQQLLLSLAFNARGAMPGGGTLILAVRSGSAPRTAGEPPPAAILEVSDNGLGMDAEERRRAFEALPAPGERRAGNLGGLAGVKAMVEAGGGEVIVRSRPGAGTIFTVTLPGAAAALPPEPERAARRARVLVVEDDIRVRALVCTALAEDGHEVSEVSDGTQAMRAIEELSVIDLLVSDVVMPGAPIGEVLTTFRSRHPAGRILVCSAFSEDEVLRQRVNTGEYRLLPKPFSRSDLLAEVRGLLAGADGPDLPADAPRRVGANA